MWDLTGRTRQPQRAAAGDVSLPAMAATAAQGLKAWSSNVVLVTDSFCLGTSNRPQVLYR